MATILNGILGGFSGTVGTVVGSSWKGIDYMRSRATSIAQPNTPAQLEQRAKFATVVKFLKPLTAFLRVGFKSQAVKMSGFNAASSYTYKNALMGTYPAFEIDYSKVLVSCGTLPGALNPTITSTLAGEIEIAWEDNSQDTNAMDDDKVLLVVYNPIKQQAVTIAGGNTRVSGTQSITLPSSFTGDEVQCFIGFKSASQSVVSNSQFAGEIVVA